MKKPLIVIVGPTASGKTALAVELAKKYNGEVVSADSMQIYKGMQIATAKPTVEEMQGIPHHLIDFAEPDTTFSVADYVSFARERIDDILERNKQPIVVGGTGLYISSLIDNVKFDDTCSNTQLREELLSTAREKGNKYLLDMLREFDRETADTLHENNLMRVIRAIEVYRETGIPLSVHKKNSRMEESPYNVCIIGLSCSDRQKLYNKINLRVDLMVQQGLVEEAQSFYSNYSPSTAKQAIGYKELIPFFEGDMSLEDCIEKVKQETRRYAKRQLTWFRRDLRVNWIFTDEFDDYKKIIELSEKIVANSKILCYNNSNMG